MSLDVSKYAARKKGEQHIPELAPAMREWRGGVPMPTALEIAEGKAYRAVQMEPDDECLREMHRRAWNALMSAQNGSMGLLRCSLCRTTKWGRRRNDACAVCKCKDGYYV